MSFLIRKIDYGKWIQRNILDGEQPSGDAITNCMKTTQNTLSLWSIDNEAELEGAVIAIAAQFDHLDSIDVLSIDLSLIEKKGLPLVPSLGLTPYHAFESKHLNVKNIDYHSLGKMAEVIVESIRQNRKKRITRGQIKKLLANAVQNGDIQWAELKPDIQKDIPQLISI